MEQLNLGSKVTKTSARVKAAKASAKRIKDKDLKPAHIIFILDNSGSMQTMSKQAIDGFNTFLSGQKEVPGKARFSLVLFNNDVTLVFDRADINKVPPINNVSYRPNGMTALYDAIGCTVNRYKNDNKKEKVILAILTDGEENVSKEYTEFAVKHLVTEVQESGWEVFFLGANLDSAAFAKSAGIKLNRSTSYDYTPAGMLNAIGAANMATTALRGSSLNVAGVTMNASNLDMNVLYKSVTNGTTSVNKDDKKYGDKDDTRF